MYKSGYIRWIQWCVVLFCVGLLTACQTPRPSSSSAKSQSPSSSKKDASSPKGAEPTETPTLIMTPKPGPTPTATPEPLAKPDTEKATKLTEEGKALFLSSDLTGAESALVEAIAADPSYLPAYLGLTDVYLYWPYYWQQALATAEAAVKLAPDDATALAYLAWAQQSAHFFEDAWDTAKHAVELAPDNAIAHAALADILSSVYQMDDAYANAKEATELDDQSAVAWATLGSITFSLENWDEAGDAYNRAVELEPDFFGWQMLVARHELNVTGDLETAEDLAAPALKSQPDHPWVLSFLVDIAIERNDWQTAEETCAKMFVFNQPHTPYPDAYTCMAGLFVLEERYAAALPYQKLAEEIATPQRRDITLLRMRLYNEQDECAKGRKLAEEWLEERSYSVLAKRMVGVGYLCDENFEQAIKYFKEASEAMPRSVADARLLANAYARDGKASEARATLNRIKSFASMDPLYYQALYEVHLFLGQYKEALKAVQRWAVLRPESSDAKVSLALVQLIDGNAKAAQSAAEDALADGAIGSTLYAVLGETYSREGRTDKAEEYLLKALEYEDDHFLARNFITSLYLSQGDCEKAEPHILWLKENSNDEESAKRFDEILEQCRKRSAQFTPDPATALDDDAVLAEAESSLKEAGVEPRSIRFAEEGSERSLFVAYTSQLGADSKDFGEQEHAISIELSRLLPRINSQPSGLIVLSGSADKPQNVIYIATRAAHLWTNGELTDEEFIATWYTQPAKEGQTGK